MAKSGKPYLPNLEPIIAAGINPKTGLPIKFSTKCTLKEDVKKFLRLIDEQDAVNRFVWYNLPANITSQELERMLYYKGQLCFFYDKDLEEFYFMPYALDGTIDFYGRYNTVHPVPMTSGTDDKGNKAQAEYLWAKANINYSEKSKSEFKSSEETEWIVSVKFKSLDEFDNNTISQKPKKELPDNEEKYKEEVLFYLEDNGVITDIERRFLEKKRIRLDISEERAKEIEEECLPKLTPEEKEYIEALKELGDADLQNPRIRRMLDHERDDLGISEERALYLEKQYCSQ